MGYTGGIAEEELKIRIAGDWFKDYDCQNIIGRIDFTVAVPESTPLQSLLWAEAKRGSISDIYKPLVQLVLTIGKARTFDTYLPPPFLGVFDAEKIAFLPYKEILPFLALNDFNWNVTPSDDTSREFGLLYDAIQAYFDREGEFYLFRYDAHATELRAFIKQHFTAKGGQIQVNKNNFVAVYQRWLATVQPSIGVDWALLKKQGIIDGDFFLADLLSEHNQTLKEALYVLLQDNRYVLDRKIDTAGFFAEKHVFFNDKQHAHRQFWSLYQRPPREEYWGYIIDRRDLLVSQDVRERKGSFFTPRQWVELSQQYIADVLGENWQEEYYVWDCAAGTGNLLNGLTNKYNIWASTLDPQDVQVMKDRIANGANLLESHVFQFDFLNDAFDKLPAGLREIIDDPEKRKKLVVYINPPYAEASTKRFTQKDRKNKTEISFTEVRGKEVTSKASRELFVQFIMKIYKQLQGVKLAQFSTLKILQAPNFSVIRAQFMAKLKACFLIPANTFDNVKGVFPIGFFIWDTSIQEPYTSFMADVYNADNVKLPFQKRLQMSDNRLLLNKWYVNQQVPNEKKIGYLSLYGNDFQHNNMVRIVSRKDILPRPQGDWITLSNLLSCCLCLTARLCLPHTWLNDRDQFLAPRDGWQTDTEFQNNCLAFTLFHGQNRITATEGVNHWIPFTEAEVDAKERFASHFMTDFMAGKLVAGQEASAGTLFRETSFIPTAPLIFSPEATAVFDAGRALWRYYHAQPHANPNASYYDIRAHFQGRNDKGKMNAKSEDLEYMRLWGVLKEAIEQLRQQIVPKVYEYGFLIE